MRICRPFADVAQLVEHFTRKGLQPFGGTGRRMAQQSRFAADSCLAARTIRLSYVISFGPVWAPLAVSAQYGGVWSRRLSGAQGPPRAVALAGHGGSAAIAA